ncbi:unnamed protein product [Dibothriocephalus latus]|uniref:CTNNB1 binding N-teminal domain-containing protein n=1 Tax=Dibothriocephalus latus TaxID=60516 RepID=A0A3P6QPY9_DIBLA|nr:unnamed protein product [Dibothriocephalus latus]
MAGFCLHICITAALMPRTVIDPAEESEETSSAPKVGSSEDSVAHQKEVSIVEGELEYLKPSGDDVVITTTTSSR